MRIVEINLDASALTQSSCKLRFKRIVIDGLKEPLPYNDTEYGSSFHRFAEVIQKHEGDFSKAIPTALERFQRPHQIREGKNHLDEHHLTKTCIDWWTWSKKNDVFQVLSVNGVPAIEVDFKLLFYEEQIGDTLYRIYLTGTIDKIGKFINGPYGFGDYKTHGLWKVAKSSNYEIRDFLKQFELSIQLRFYAFCLRLKAQRAEEGNPLREILKEPIAGFIEGIFISKNDPTRFVRGDIKIFKDEELNELENLIIEKCKILIWLHQNPNYEIKDGIIHGSCVDGRYDCRFKKLCMAPDNIARGFIMQQYKIEPYDPLKFSK